MPNELIINVTPHETRAALIESGLVTELYMERDYKRGFVGNIYKGRVLRVLPGMQAAFVDIGLDKAAFLYVSDVYQSEWQDYRFFLKGEEDGDFEWRYGNKTQGRSVPSVMLPGIINHTDSENCLKNMSIVNKKYAKFNNYFTYEVKYKIDDLKGVQHGIMPVKVECISPTPTLHCTEKFYWDNIDRL